MKAPSPLFISKEGLATFWFLLAAAAVLGTGIYVMGLVGQKALRPQFIIMSNPDVLPMVAERDPAAESALIRIMTRLAMDSIFNKSGSGLDAPDRCRKILAPEPWNWVEAELLQKQADVFRDSRMHQKVEIERIELFPQTRDDATLASVQGQLLRVGIYDGKIFNEVWAVRAEIMWVTNPSLRDSGRIPLLCSAFTCREVPVASTLRRATPESPAEPSPPPAAEDPSK
jgi:hypothetical protein